MSGIPRISSDIDAQDEGFKAHRFRQIAGMLFLVMTLSMLQNLYFANWASVISLLVGIAMLAWALRLSFQGPKKRQLANAILLGALTALLSVIVWLDQGIRDAAMLGFPGVLIFAGLLGTRRQLIGIYLVMALVITACMAANVEGWHVNRVLPLRYGGLIDLLGILSATAFAVMLLTGDLHLAVQRSRKESERAQSSATRVAFLAHHDPLTELPNRLLVREQFTKVAEQARMQGRTLALVFVDLDNFKTFNDSLGHTAGDALLLGASRRMASVLNEGQILSRYGGDEFLVLAPDLKTGDAAVAIASELLKVMSVPLSTQGHDVRLTCSIGIAVLPDDGESFESLLKKADIALYRAKEAGRNTFRFFDATMNEGVIEHLHLISGLRTALAENQLVLHYQPQIELLSGRLVGAEALVRWRHPELGLVYPTTFIPVAERSGVIIEIGEWVLREACRQASIWREGALPDFVVSVNLSAVQFKRGNLDRIVYDALECAGLPAHALELELTESALIQDIDMVAELLQRLRMLGVSLSIDDFGTGYSNLAYLKRLHVERLKIDQSFIGRLHEDVQDAAIVQAIIQMAGSLGLTTTAEGIEDAITLARLTELGCTHGQGFLFSRPLPAEDFLRYAAEYEQRII
ncbi:MAG: EAL domain-containing protein [Burkholderiales bacterium]|nr:EAL domain-containing protein [Burkholderiales bacterium]